MKNKNLNVLSLKYRPQTFKDLIGQEVASETIQNSIKLNKVPNAYLFCGIRGVGKTTFARIISKALNCKNGLEKMCSEVKCDNCKSISESNHIDVLEMDAASKTGVDDVRDLIEFSRYGPSIAKYKIFIIDEVHMLSKQAFNALLKTLEEPPEYLKFIFATTEIKKIPITVISRCQRYDLQRIDNLKLFEFLKKIKDLEKGNIENDVLQMIVKISEGSVRDSLSLLDQAMLMQNKNKKLGFEEAKKIFGFLDKSTLIDLFDNLFSGNEDKVIQFYRSIYSSGVEPRVFINDFLEILYYLKNINFLKKESTSFLLNSDDFRRLTTMSKKIDAKDLLLFWNFTIKVTEELNIVSNQNLSVEMFLIRLLHIRKNDAKEKNDEDSEMNFIKKESYQSSTLNEKTIEQIKNISQEEKVISSEKNDNEKNNLSIKNFDDLLEVCTKKKEMILKYELETNVRLVSFIEKRIEISFNESLNKDFVKILSTKLYEWTNQRWIITFSSKSGETTIREKKKINFEKNLKETEEEEFYKNLSTKFEDIELVEIKENNNE